MTAPQILVVDDEANIRMLIEEILSDEGYAVATASDAAEARSRVRNAPPSLILLDIWMPDTDGITLLKEWCQDGAMQCPVVIMSGHGTVETAMEATRLGAVDFIEKPLSLTKLLRTVEGALEQQPGERRRGEAYGLLHDSVSPPGKSAAMRDLRALIEQVAPHTAPVAFIGEPGSGRAGFARYLHARSNRSQQAFVEAGAGSITPANAAAVLLGRNNGGIEEPGFLARAQGGTLFINELGSLCDEGQAILAGVLDQGSYAPEGSTRQQPLDIRVMASVTPDAGSLRPDLLTQLSVLQVRVPALREYAEDVSELLRNAVDRLVDAQALGYRRFSVAAQNRLRNYPWPGNIAELENLVQRLLVAGGPEEISLAEAEGALAGPPDGSATGGEPLVKQDLLSLPLREAREAFERAYLTQQLSLCDGKVGQLAKRVGMERTHLYRKLRALGVDFRAAK